MSPLSIFGGPWGWLIKWGIIAALAAAWSGYFYVKGINHQQEIDAVAHAKAVQESDDFNSKQRAKQHQIAQKYLEDKANAEKQSAGLRHALMLALDGLRIRSVAAAAVTGMPSDRPSTSGSPGAADVDARFSAAVQHDALGYGPCTVQLNYLIEAVDSGGGNKP